MPLLPTTKKRLLNSARFNVSNGCIEWTGAVATSGYGVIHWKGVPTLVHRIAWELEHGKIPDGLWVLHRCDNKICIKPGHLFLGTQRDNNKDCWEKGRVRRGERHRNAKLKEWQVLEIARSGDRYSVLAARYGVSWEAVREIKLGRNWTWLTKLHRHAKIKK